MSEASLPPHGGQLRQIAARYGVAPEHLLDFSVNINPSGPPASAMAAIQKTLANPAALSAYPDLDLADLKQTIASCIAAQPEHIAVANGFVPLLEAALRSLGIKRCLLPVPCFNEYRKTIENTNATAIPYILLEHNHFAYSIDSMIEALHREACDAILLTNPQNPSGVLCRTEEMTRLIEIASDHGVNVLLDEAFIDYCHDQSLTRTVIDRSNLIVFRSVTKFFAIPGLRVAYSICNASQTQNMNRRIAPWPVTGLASDAVCAALCDEAYAVSSRADNVRRREWLTQELAKLEIESYPSSTNFLLLRFPAEIDVQLLWERILLEHKIVLRSCTNFEGLSPGHLRIAVRSEAENERLIASLEQTLSRL